jgi:subtilisin family serine protease
MAYRRSIVRSSSSRLTHVRSRAGALTAAAALAALAACADQGPTAPATAPSLAKAAGTSGRSVIIGRGGALPANLEAQVRAAGGTLERVIPQIGVAFASGLRSTNLTGVESVVPDLAIVAAPPSRTEDLAADAAGADVGAAVASLADNEPFYAFQWAPAAVQAPEAWNLGYTGAGVRVAVLDGGLYAAHADLAAGVDVGASRSFITGAFNTDVGTFWHGTHVAGIIGARDNGIGLIGIAPGATLIGVKVLHAGTGSFGGVLEGIVYAATPQAEGGAGADIINMSLGAYIPNPTNDRELRAVVRELEKAFDRAAAYANKQGTTVIAAAGNDGSSLDVNKFDVSIPAMSQRVIAVSATAPFGWAYGNRDFSRQSSYTNFGKAVIDLAAPGGDFAWPTNENCTVAGLTRACRVFDMYLSTARGSTAAGTYSWAAGTSMASPVAAGVAALIIEANGGSMHPAQVRARLMQGAVDLGKPGFDDVYGHGFVNALNSVQK